MYTLDLPTYPNLVLEFYENTKVEFSSIEFEIKKVKITLNIDQLEYLLTHLLVVQIG